MRSGLAALATLRIVAGGILAGGCVDVTDFDPVGDAASIEFAWTVDGEFPTNESCEALGAAYVRVTFVDDRRAVPHGGLLRNCASCAQGAPASCLNARPCMRGGEVECFDTEDQRVVAEGDWTIRLEAVDGSGAVVQASPEAVYSTTSGRIEVAQASFLSGRISALVVLDGQAPTFAGCEDAGLATVELVFDAAGGEVAPGAIEPCTVGGIGTRVAPGASYTVRLRALAADGSVAGETAPETFLIEPGQQVTLNGGEPIELTAL